MDVILEDIVYEKLKKYNLISSKEITEKNMSRLIRIEEYIQECNAKAQAIIKDLKGIELTKTSVSKCDKIRISRKTIYNEKILSAYIDNSIKESEDYLNQRKLLDLENQLKVLKTVYDKLIDDIIETNILKMEIRNYEEQINGLINENENLQLVLNDKDKEIKRLQIVCTQQNNVIKLRESI